MTPDVAPTFRIPRQQDRFNVYQPLYRADLQGTRALTQMIMAMDSWPASSADSNSDTTEDPPCTEADARCFCLKYSCWHPMERNLGKASPITQNVTGHPSRPDVRCQQLVPLPPGFRNTARFGHILNPFRQVLAILVRKVWKQFEEGIFRFNLRIRVHPCWWVNDQLFQFPISKR
ncbi:hypothetical protein TNCV_2615641 [Trichonephila clavipes]|nr:hypothetical protein TNCV_2615641 [Trichonephila clavipes]